MPHRVVTMYGNPMAGAWRKTNTQKLLPFFFFFSMTALCQSRAQWEEKQRFFPSEDSANEKPWALFTRSS